MSNYQYGITVGENGLVICGKNGKAPSWGVPSPDIPEFLLS